MPCSQDLSASLERVFRGNFGFWKWVCVLLAAGGGFGCLSLLFELNLGFRELV